jgi:DNA helicase-2/ATP-dependent DNA helicase PcrA
MVDFDGDLNSAQREAVVTSEGPLLVLAGAGSGKTRVLTYRIAHLVERCAIPPWNVLAVTFTNKAAQEMRERAERLLGTSADGLWVGTFHATCARILRREAQHLELPPNFVIYDADDQRRLLKRIIGTLGLTERICNPVSARASISHLKNRLREPEEAALEARTPYERRVADVYKEYQKQLARSGALDFADLLLKAVELFERNAEVLQSYQGRFRYILVDEYQDTNRAQYVLLRLLAAKHRNICAVGDDDQSIYGWRGADLRNILEFEQDFPEARVVRLEQNYRSTKTILRAASAVVSRNRGRKEKTLWTENEAGEELTIHEAEDERDEAWQVTNAVRKHLQSGGKLRDVVILYRTNAQSRALEEALRWDGVAYTVVGGTRFYERREVKDVLAYLRLVVNSKDDLSFRRIVNCPKRGIGEGTLALVEEFARARALSLLEACALEDGIPGVPQGRMKRLRKLGALLKDAGESVSTVEAGEIARRLVEGSGYLAELEGEDTVEAEGRRENVQELINAASAFSHTTGEGLAEFLAEVTLFTDVDEWKGSQGVVTLMTLHCAKGLEFPVVFITGLEDGLFPLARSSMEPREMEEERRLFYVGITRAMQKLHLSWARNRRRFTGGAAGVPSRFLQEIPPELFDSGRPSWSVPVPLVPMGGRVGHPTWGEGIVVLREGYGGDLRVTVRFTDGIERKFVLRHSPLQPLD